MYYSAMGLLAALVLLNSDSVYKPLLLRDVWFVTQILFLTVISVFALTAMIRAGHSTKEAGVRYRIAASFGMIIALFLFIQLWFPYFPLYSIAYMLGTCLVHSFVADDEKQAHKRALEEAEKVTMTVEKTAEFEDRTSLRFRIKDTGSGMDREFINELFGEYTPGSTKHSSAGSKGLGLKITKRIVDMMNGLEASKTIRSMAREDAKRIPIIALTGNSFDEDVQLSMQAGMNAHLTKPVEADHLLRILGELIYEAEQTL